MFRNRRSNRLIRRIALGFAVAAFVAPVAPARVDEDIPGQPNAAQIVKGSQVTLSPGPRGLPHAPAINHTDLVHPALVLQRSTPIGASSDRIEFVRTQPRSTGEPHVVAGGYRDWKNAGIGWGIAFTLVLLGIGALLAARHLGRRQTA